MAVVGNIPIQENGYHEGNEDTLDHHVLTSQSYAGILAGMDNGVAFTLAIPLMVAHRVTMLSPSVLVQAPRLLRRRDPPQPGTRRGAP